MRRALPELLSSKKEEDPPGWYFYYGEYRRQLYDQWAKSGDEMVEQKACLNSSVENRSVEYQLFFFK